jgi:hypothetical protein
MERTGGCFCSQIRYRSRVDPQWVGQERTCRICADWVDGFSVMARPPGLWPEPR